MAFNPRYYQIEAIDAVFDYWNDNDGNPLLDMAGGSGKSGTMAMLIKRLISDWADMRVLSCVHVKELVTDNFKEFIGLFPFADAGIHAASLNRRDIHNQVIFAQLQTVWSKAKNIGHIDVLVIDEVHLVPDDNNTMYRRFIKDLLLINPEMKIVGFTATPYRFNSGRLDEGDDRLFDKIVYTYSVAQGIEDGYLTRLTSKPLNMKYDVSGVKKLGGDFKKSDLADATDKEELTIAAVAEMMRYVDEENRKTAVIFCNGIEHATHVRDEIRKHGKSCEILHGKTSDGERDRIIADLRSGKLWGCTNDNVLSTGTNIPRIDLVVDLAPTQSTNRYVQRAVRGTRVIWPAGFNPDEHTAEERKQAIARGPKPNCRYMNFAGNIERHGPIDCVNPKAPGKGNGEAPVKICPKCEELCAASTRICPNCSNEFIFDETPKFSAVSGDVAIIAAIPPEQREITRREFRHHPGKGGKADTVKASYYCGLMPINEWLCPGHTGYPKVKADKFWHLHGGKRPFPKDAMDFLTRQSELKQTESIMVKPDGKYWTVVGHVAGDVVDGDDGSVKETHDAIEPKRASWMDELDDDIPF